MTASDRRSGVSDLRARPRYRPDVVGLACARVAAARERAGLPVAEFASALEPLLGWAPDAGLVKAWESAVDPPGHIVIACEVIASRPPRAGGIPPLEPGNADDQVASAVDEAEREWLQFAAEPGPESICLLWDEMTEVARAANRSAYDTFMTAQRVRRRAVKVAEQARRPGTLSDLYAIAGQATALTASTAFDLHRWASSAALARSAVSYAEMAGHDSLHAWTLGLVALLANWRHEPSTALDCFHRGLQIAPPGAPRVRLRYIAARSYALLGDAVSVGKVLEAAWRDQEQAEQRADPLSDEVGGEFAFGRARAEACAASAWLDLGCGAEAKEAAQRALAELTRLSPACQPLSQVNGARADLVSACLLNHDRDEAAEVVAKVLSVPSALMNVSLSGRLDRVMSILGAPLWSGDTVVRHLAEALSHRLAEQRRLRMD
jgi:hypothetical protein